MDFENKKLKEFEEFIRFRKVAIIGLGVSNIPLLDYFYEKKARVTIFEERNIESISKNLINKIHEYEFNIFTGEKCLENMKNFDIIFRSPSCLPTVKELEEDEKRGAIVTTEIEMLMKMCPCKIIGITGSDGKTTTTRLIYEILIKSGYNAYLGGNIGTPLFTKLSEMTPEDIVVLELSSFQLMGMEVSPDISVITNISPNHLNIHKDYEEYIDSKKNIFKYQNENGILVLNYDNKITRLCAREAKGKIIFFSGTEKLDTGYIIDEKVIKQCADKIRKHIINTSEITLRGKHNYENVATALAATSSLVKIEDAITAIKEFKSVEHRLELICEINNIKWYNDSVSSSPSRTIAGLNSFEEEIVLIAGGYDKNLDYTPLAKPIVDKVKTLILIGQTSGKIFEAVKEELELEKKEIDIYICETLEQSVELAYKVSISNQVVLFSPASASFDMFKDFADRGRKFKNLVNNIKS